MVDRDIPEEMVEKAARAIAEQIGMRDQLYPVESPDFPAHRRDIAQVVLSAALEGCAVVQLPAPDGSREQLDGVLTFWNVDGWSVTVKPGDKVSIATGSELGGGLGFQPDTAPRIAAAMVAATRRLASGSGVGDHHE